MFEMNISILSFYFYTLLSAHLVIVTKQELLMFLKYITLLFEELLPNFIKQKLNNNLKITNFNTTM